MQHPPNVAGGIPSDQHQWMMMHQQQQSQPVPPPAGWNPQPVPPPVPESNEVKSLWIGDLQPYMDENYLLSCFSHTGEVLSAKVIRNKQTGLPEGYGFIEFVSHAAAERTLHTYNGSLMPNSDQNFRMNWASLGAGEKRQDEGPEYSIFVGDLAADVTDYILQETFRPHYSSIKGAKVVTDRTTGRSKGYGFVKFGDESEQLRAMTEMNGMYCSSRPMRVGPAANKKAGSGSGMQYQQGHREALIIGGLELISATYQGTQGNQGENDPNNTTIFVGALDPNVSEDHLRQVFGQYGELHSVKIPVGKRCGFVQFANRNCAEQALAMLNGTQLGGQNIRLSWGRNPSNKQAQAEQTQYGGYYGYPQGYEAYGYAPPPQNPNMFYGSYAGYNYQQGGTYQQQQQ